MQMLIKGIRSFSPDNTHVIEFYKPLTLIVGQNGAGKTVRACLHVKLRLSVQATSLTPGRDHRKPDTAHVCSCRLSLNA